MPRLEDLQSRMRHGHHTVIGKLPTLAGTIRGLSHPTPEMETTSITTRTSGEPADLRDFRLSETPLSSLTAIISSRTISLSGECALPITYTRLDPDSIGLTTDGLAH